MDNERNSTKLGEDSSIKIPDAWWQKCPFLRTVDVIFFGYDESEKVVVIRKKH